ncbi:MAG: hypothetical protein IIC02_08800 [Planctomycetes bacterium]|nr:hypothetical protein [Planctomycetota bacterium]
MNPNRFEYASSPVAALAVAAALLIGGCPPPERIEPFDPVPMRQALHVLNENAAAIGGTLRATGSVDGFFTDDGGRKRRFHVDGVLFFLSPSYLRFDLKKFGDRQVLFGSNEVAYWVYMKDGESWYCGEHDAPGLLPRDVPVKPGQLVDALGLNPVSIGAGDARLHSPIQRVTESYQQILFLEYDKTGRLVLEKEYWLDRYPPRLVRRVVFRDGDGVVEMESRLDDYRPLESGGPLLPRIMTAGWPQSGAQIRFRIDQWKRFDEIKQDAIQFKIPRACHLP